MIRIWKNRRPAILWPIVPWVLLLSTGCQLLPGQATEQSTLTGTLTSQPYLAAESVHPQASHGSGWLTVDDLQHFLNDLKRRAESENCTAAWVQPDPVSGQSFLAVAADQASALAIQGYFYWFLDSANQEEDQPDLLLVLDRLFSDQTRTSAMAGGKYADPGVISLLDYSLGQMLGDHYEPAITTFILTCYRDDFAGRLHGAEISEQTWKQAFQNIEVTYEASITSTIAFHIPTEAT